MNIKYRKRTLTAQERKNIVSDYNAGIKVKVICKEYRVSRQTVYDILARVAWEGESK